VSILPPPLRRSLPDHPDVQVEIVIDYDLTDIVAQGYDAGGRLGEQSILCGRCSNMNRSRTKGSEQDRTEAVTMAFPSSQTIDPDDRFEEITNHAYEAVGALLAEANQAGWSTSEITEALVLAVETLRVAHRGDVNPAEEQSQRTISPAAEQQSVADLRKTPCQLDRSTYEENPIQI
jgi:hypothetical protein